MFAMELSGFAVAFQAAKDCRPRDFELAASGHDRFKQRLAPIVVRFQDMHAQDAGFHERIRRTISTSEITSSPSSSIPSITSAAARIFSGESITDSIMGKSRETCRKLVLCS